MASLAEQGKLGHTRQALLRTLKSTTSRIFDLEAGDLAIEGLAIDTIRPRTWRECRDFAVFIGGPNPALRKCHIPEGSMAVS